MSWQRHHHGPIGCHSTLRLGRRISQLAFVKEEYDLRLAVLKIWLPASAARKTEAAQPKNEARNFLQYTDITIRNTPSPTMPNLFHTVRFASTFDFIGRMQYLSA
jgi:hypothetical protein